MLFCAGRTVSSKRNLAKNSADNELNISARFNIAEKFQTLNDAACLPLYSATKKTCPPVYSLITPWELTASEHSERWLKQATWAGLAAAGPAFQMETASLMTPQKERQQWEGGRDFKYKSALGIHATVCQLARPA